MLGFDLQTKNPNYPALDTGSPEVIARYLASRNFIGPEENVLRIEPLGDAARNRIRRIVTDTRSFVLKQFCAWPAVSERPAPGPEERFRAEMQFYRSARIADCAKQTLPAVLHHDAQAGCILLEDAGAALPLSGRRIPPEVARQLGWFLVSLHHHSRSVPACAHYRNEQVLGWQMARLFSWAPGRGTGAWLARWRDQSAEVGFALEDALAALERGGTSLVHGDYTPANWVQNGHGPQVVDGEFSFFGPPEYDAGAYLAGLMAEGHPRETLAAAVEVIERGCFRYDPRLVAAYAGVHLCDALAQAHCAGRSTRLCGSSARAALRRLQRALETRSLGALILPAAAAAHGERRA